LSYPNPSSDPYLFYSHHPPPHLWLLTHPQPWKYRLLPTATNYLASPGWTLHLVEENKIYCEHRRKMTRLDSLIYSVKQDKAGFCKGNLTNLRRILHLSLAKGNPKRTL
jgi:hypothetical protein